MILLNKLKNIYHLFKYESSILSYSLRSTQSYETNITEFINNSSLSSKTKYLIWVDTINFKTNIFKGQQHNWILINWRCAYARNYHLHFASRDRVSYWEF